MNKRGIPTIPCGYYIAFLAQTYATNLILMVLVMSLEILLVIVNNDYIGHEVYKLTILLVKLILMKDKALN